MRFIFRIINKLFKKISWLISDVCWFFCFAFRTQKQTVISNITYSIGITTFKDRYRPFFKPLLKRITYLFPDTEIIVVLNGHVNEIENTNYILQCKNFIKDYPNVKVLVYEQPHGLSKLWNQLIINSSYAKVLLLNDDLSIKKNFRKNLEENNFFMNEIALINLSWSHFAISKSIVKIVGWFDERLNEISGEDDDYSARLAIMNIPIYNLYSTTIKNSSVKHKLNSYGHNMTGEVPYSKVNSEFLFNKWKVSNEHFTGSVLVENRNFKYWKLSDGMETPDFYPEYFRKWSK